jgi:hypothetical protein
VTMTSCSGSQPATSPAASSMSPIPAQTTQQAANAPTAAPAASAANTQGPCVLSPAEVKAAFAEWIGPGEVSINAEYTGNERCTYSLPAGSLPLNGHGGKVIAGDSSASISIDRYEYAKPKDLEIGVLQTRRKYGGTTPAQVFNSVTIAQTDVNAASGSKSVVEAHPEIGGGAVIDGAAEFTLAGTGAYWYQGGISGVSGDPGYVPALINLAKAINAKG